MEQSCTDLADALDMPRTGSGEMREQENGYEYQEGELLCKFSESGSLKLIAAMGLSGTSGEGVPMFKDAGRATQLAEEALEKTDFAFDGPIQVKPELPWDDAKNLVYVSAEPEAFGYPTLGFAGRIGVEINRYTEQIVSISIRAERVPDPPVFNLTEEDALAIAEPIWDRGPYADRDAKSKMNKQYYVASGKHATAEGERYADEGRVRMCWQAAYWTEAMSRDGTLNSRPLASILIDAETGEVLSKP